jgi:Fusaric acid resistance protein family
LRGKQVQLRRMILSLDKIIRLIFSYAKARPKFSTPIATASRETAILDGLKKEAQRFHQEFEAGRVPSYTGTRPAMETDGEIGPRLQEAASTMQDLAGGDEEESENHPQKAAARHKPSLFVADAFTNPRHAQFAIKVTLAGMLGYLFYTASDYYGIHTVFYTPLIIALASTGATIHKGFLRIAGCIIGGVLGLICSIWVIPRYETLGTFLFIVFCVHGLAAWIASGSERISYIGLQVALAFDLGFLQGYGPPTEIDPLRDRFIGIVIGICIITTVFSLVWPESADSIARLRLAACLRAIARLLHLGGSGDGSQSSTSQREQLELEIASSFSEANLYEEQAAFEALLYRSEGTAVSRLAAASEGVEEIYVACLPWLREQASSRPTPQGGEHPKTERELTKLLADAVEESADFLEEPADRTAGRSQLPANRLLERRDLRGRESSDSRSLEELIGAVAQMQLLVQTPAWKSHEPRPS